MLLLLAQETNVERPDESADDKNSSLLQRVYKLRPQKGRGVKRARHAHVFYTL